MKIIRNNDEELDVLERMLYALHLSDFVIWFDKKGILHAEDSNKNKWRGNEFYEFLTEECLCFNPDGTLSEGQYVREDLLDSYKHYSIQNGVIPGSHN